MLYGQGGLFAAALGKVLGDDIGHAVTQADVFEQIVQSVEAELIKDVGNALAGKVCEIGIDVCQAAVEEASPEGRDSVTC